MLLLVMCIFFLWRNVNVHRHLQYMMNLIDNKPDLYLDEIAIDLAETLGVTPSLSTIHCSIKLLGYTTKMV